MKPGLWDVNSKMKSPNGEMEAAMTQMQAALAAMPPTDRKRMEAAMEKQGVRLGTGSGGAMNTKICISKEMAEQKSLPFANGANCTEKRGPFINGRMKVSYRCTNPAAHGDGELAFSGDSAMTMKMNTSSTQNGRTEQMSIESDARWLSADCGTLKPPPVFKQK